MSIVLAIWGLLNILFALIMFTIAKSAIHEIESGLAFLIATVAIGCASIIEAVKAEHKHAS